MVFCEVEFQAVFNEECAARSVFWHPRIMIWLHFFEFLCKFPLKFLIIEGLRTRNY